MFSARLHMEDTKAVNLFLKEFDCDQANTSMNDFSECFITTESGENTSLI